MHLSFFNIISIALSLIVAGSITPSTAIAQDKNVVTQLEKQTDQILKTIEEIQKKDVSLNIVSKPDLDAIRFGKIVGDKEIKIQEAISDKIKYLQDNGGVDSGGGTIVTTIDGRKGLLDYFTNAPEFFCIPESHPRIRIEGNKSFWNKDRWSGRFKFETLDTQGALLRLIKSWQKTSPKMANYLESAYNNIPVYFLNYPLDMTDQKYFIPDHLKDQIASMETIAYYRRQTGLLISKPGFEDQTYIDQIGLLMRELLRHIQITYDFHFTPEEMQKFNVTLLKGPYNGNSLDSIVTLNEGAIQLYENIVSLSALSTFKDIHTYSLRHNLGINVPLKVTRESIHELMDQLYKYLVGTNDPKKIDDLKTLYSRLHSHFEGLIFISLIQSSSDRTHKDAIQGLNLGIVDALEESGLVKKKHQWKNQYRKK